MAVSAHSHGHEHEHEFEAAHGLPEALPPNERMLWQGAPDWRALARDAMHLRQLALYFAVLLILRGTAVISDGGTPAQAVLAAAWLLPLAGVALGVLGMVAWLMGRTTVYTITDRRVVMRVGIVLTVTFNLPYSAIESAALRDNPDGSGDLVLALSSPDKIAYAHLWPHARPWRLRHPQPMLRAIANVRSVASILSGALAAAAGLPAVRVSPAATRPGPALPSEPANPLAV
jgi:hypothetical protein